MRVSSPPVVSPCFYGIDMADEDELAAAHRSVEEMRAHIGATSLHYLSVEGMQEATQLPEDSVCRACFTRGTPDARAAEDREAPLRAGARLGAARRERDEDARRPLVLGVVGARAERLRLGRRDPRHAEEEEEQAGRDDPRDPAPRRRVATRAMPHQVTSSKK